MERFAMILVVLGLVGCAMQSTVVYDPWRQKLMECGTVIGTCGSVTW